jgi:hypothetical protein
VWSLPYGAGYKPALVSVVSSDDETLERRIAEQTTAETLLAIDQLWTDYGTGLRYLCAPIYDALLESPSAVDVYWCQTSPTRYLVKAHHVDVAMAHWLTKTEADPDLREGLWALANENRVQHPLVLLTTSEGQHVPRLIQQAIDSTTQHLHAHGCDHNRAATLRLISTWTDQAQFTG